MMVRGMVATAVGMLGMVVLGGCGLIGGFYGIFIDPLIPAPQIKAEHDMREQRVLVWVDDFATVDQHPQLRSELTRQITRELTDNKAAKSVVEYADVTRWRDRHADFSMMSLAELGEQLDADEVLHVWIEKFQYHHEAGTGYYRTNMTGSAKVIDVGTGQQVWPMDQTHRPFARVGNLTEGTGPMFEKKLVRELSATIAQEISRCFYKHASRKAFQ